MTIREQIEQQLKEVTNTPDKSEIKNTLIEAMRWVKANKTDMIGDSFETGVAFALSWVLGVTKENPIDEEYQEEQ